MGGEESGRGGEWEGRRVREEKSGRGEGWERGGKEKVKGEEGEKEGETRIA